MVLRFACVCVFDYFVVFALVYCSDAWVVVVRLRLFDLLCWRCFVFLILDILAFSGILGLGWLG